MTRMYTPLLDLAEDLESFGSGYLSDLQKQQINKIQMRFDAERRKFVYELFHEGLETNNLWPSVSDDLDRIQARGNQSHGALAMVREALEKHIEKQANNSPVKRFLVRWTLPTLGVIAAIGYTYLQYIRSN